MWLSPGMSEEGLRDASDWYLEDDAHITLEHCKNEEKSGTKENARKGRDA
jgi:hypothetical protein